MKINLIWPGKTKERFIREGVEKYLKLLMPYADVSIIVLKEEKGSDGRKVVKKEEERILKLKLPYILLDERGKSCTSVEFAGYFAESVPPVNFVFGGAFGVSEKIKAMALTTLSLSRMTFTHEMSRLFMLEQLYRAFTITHKRGYHH